LALSLAGGPAFAQGEAIDLKLFNRADVGPNQGCSVALWQADRDPDKDRFALVFHERLAAD